MTRIHVESLMQACDQLVAELGRVDDFSQQLANTILNVYYRSLVVGSQQLEEFAQPYYKYFSGPIDVQEYSNLLSTTLSHRKFISETIRSAREAIGNDPSSKEGMDVYLIRSFKYNNPDSNSGFVRNAFRALKAKVYEIDGLYDYAKSKGLL